jgi:hypothetical protein
VEEGTFGFVFGEKDVDYFSSPQKKLDIEVYGMIHIYMYNVQVEMTRNIKLQFLPTKVRYGMRHWCVFVVFLLAVVTSPPDVTHETTHSDAPDQQRQRRSELTLIRLPTGLLRS